MSEAMPTSMRLTPETKKQVKILSATYDIKIADFFEKALSHIARLPRAELERIFK